MYISLTVFCKNYYKQVEHSLSLTVPDRLVKSGGGVVFIQSLIDDKVEKCVNKFRVPKN